MNSLIKQYINKMNINTINDFAVKNNIFLDHKELEILYEVALKNADDILKGDDSSALDVLEKNLSADNYKKVVDLYNEYRLKFGRYLL